MISLYEGKDERLLITITPDEDITVSHGDEGRLGMARRIVFFCKSRCSACANLKRYLDSKSIVYEEIHGDTAEGATYMRINGIFLSYYPALCVEKRLYQYADLFDSHGDLLDLGEILK